MKIDGKVKISELLELYPFLKADLIAHNEKAKNLENPVIYNTVGRFARVCDVAKVFGEEESSLISFLEERIAAQGGEK